MSTYAPIILIVFNRPEHTKRVIEALSANPLALESDLHIFSDGSRGPKDDASVQAVKNVIQKIEGFKQVYLHLRIKNVGCSSNVLTAVDTVLESYDKCIVVEDDILVAPNFLEFMNQALNYYQDNETIFSIGAFHPFFKIPAKYPHEVYALGRNCSWGWGVWKNSWKKINLDPKQIRKELSDSRIRKAFAQHGEDTLRTFEHDPEIWDLRVSYGQWKCGLMTIFPTHSFTENIGRDGSGVHYHGNALKVESQSHFPGKIPNFVPLIGIDESIRLAHKKSTHKSILRIKTTQLLKKTGLYLPLFRLWEKLGLQ